MDRLFVAVLGHREAGKSTTWRSLLGGDPSAGPRRLSLFAGQCVNVYLAGGFADGRVARIHEAIAAPPCRILLGSLDYADDGRRTADLACEHGFELLVQWLNPGYQDTARYYDRLGLEPWLLDQRATVAIRNGHQPAGPRTEEIRAFIHGWAAARGLTFPATGPASLVMRT